MTLKAKKTVPQGSASSVVWKYIFLFLVLFVITNMYLFQPFADSGWLRIATNTSRTVSNFVHMFGKDVETEAGQSKSVDDNFSAPGNASNSCADCFLHNFKYVVSNQKICSGFDNNALDLVILVMTKHDREKRRNVLRRTWLSISKNNTAHVRYAFVLGGTSNKTLQSAIERENSVHHDIIQEDFVDSYKNLTLKTIMIFKWAASYCTNARFVMKTDDDMYVNIPNLLKRIRIQNTNHTKLYGVCWSSAPIRNVKSKWYVPVAMYPHKKYPMFCSGTGYVTSLSTTAKLYEVSKHVPFFYLEDVYVGMCLQKIGGSTVSVPGFMKVAEGQARQNNACQYKADTFITGHGFSPEMIEHVWSAKC